MDYTTTGIGTTTALHNDVLIVANMDFTKRWFKSKLQRRIEAEINDWVKYRTIIYINSVMYRESFTTIAMFRYTTDSKAVEYKLVDAVIKGRNVTIIGHSVLRLAESINNAHDANITVNLDLIDDSSDNGYVTIEERLYESQVNVTKEYICQV